MATPDWKHPAEQKWTFKFLRIPPNKLNDVRGEITDVDISSVTITEGYYTDTRTQAKLTYYGYNPYSRQDWVRIIATETNTGYTEELGTFIPSNDDVTIENGVRKTTLTLESVLYGISQQKLQRPWATTAGNHAWYVYSNIIVDYCGIDLSSWSYGDTYDKHGNYNPINDVDLPYSAICEQGSSLLELLYGVANATNNRLDVDGHGRPCMNKYIAPANRSPTFTIGVFDDDSVTLNGFSRTSNYLELPSQVTIHATKTDNSNNTQTIDATATAGGRLSQSERGYIVGKYKELTEMSPFTQAQANKLAQEWLARVVNERVEWDLTTLYMPIYTGDVGILQGLTADEYEYGTAQKVFVKNREITLSNMTQKLTLKSCKSNDIENEEDY